jgi:hypothetical protein
VWGTACLIAPSRMTDSAGGPSDPRTLAVTRVLGARHLVQAVVSGLVPTRRVLVVGGLIDMSHSATMALVGGLDPSRRRLAWADGAMAAGWGAASVRQGCNQPGPIVEGLR